MTDDSTDACISRRYQINRILDQHADSASLNFYLATELEREGKTAIAMLHFKRVRELDPFYFSAYIQAARMLANEGVYSLARDVLMEGVPRAQAIGEAGVLAEMNMLLEAYDLKDLDSKLSRS